jgi:hypothetical protein
MYLKNAITSLLYGASLSLLSLCIMAWVPRPVVLIMFGSGVLLLAYGWVITLYMSFTAIMDQWAFGSEYL